VVGHVVSEKTQDRDVVTTDYEWEVEISAAEKSVTVTNKQTNKTNTQQTK